MMDRPDDVRVGDKYRLRHDYHELGKGTIVVLSGYHYPGPCQFYRDDRIAGRLFIAWEYLEEVGPSEIQTLTAEVEALKAELAKLKPEQTYQYGDVFSMGPTAVQWIITSGPKNAVGATCISTGAILSSVRVSDAKALSMRDIDRVLGIGSRYLGRGAKVNE